MPENKNKNIEVKNSSENIDEIEELKTYLKKKKIQTEALKKIITKLNTDKNITTDK